MTLSLIHISSKLMFIPYEASTYVITVTLRSTIDEKVLATATHTVKTGVVVSEVASLDDITVDYGTPLNEIGLPEQVEVTLKDNSVCQVDVEWNTGTPYYNENEPGIYTFTGTLVPGVGIINPDKLTATVVVNVSDPVPSTYIFSYEVPDPITKGCLLYTSRCV